MLFTINCDIGIFVVSLYHLLGKFPLEANDVSKGVC